MERLAARAVISAVLLLVGSSLAASPSTLRGGYPPAEFVVRFAPDMVDGPSEGVSAFSDGIVADPDVFAELIALGTYELRTVCNGWRNLGAQEDVLDINGVPLVAPLIDFGDVYVVRYAAFDDPADASARLERLPGVEYAHPNYYVEGTSCSCPSGTIAIGDSLYPSVASDPGQWALHNPGAYSDAVVTAVEDIDINLPEAWKIHREATTQVGVIDLGFDFDHPDMIDVFDEDDAACFGDSPCNADDLPPGSDQDHGNASASIIGARANKGPSGCVADSLCTGIAGILGHPDSADSLVVPIRLAGTNHTVNSNLADAIAYAAQSLRLPVVNLSVTGRGGSGVPLVRDAMRNAYQIGTLLVVSAGNNAAQGATPPQIFDRFALGVGAIGIEGEHHESGDSVVFATGRHVDVVAPAASNVLHAVGSVAANATGYWRFHDTSSAAPHVAGSAALVLSYVDDLTNDDLTELLSRRARNIVDTGELWSGYDETFGFGLVRLDSTLCWLTENDVGRGFVAGWDDTSSVGEVRQFLGLPGDTCTTAKPYFARVYRLQRDVPFTDYTGSTALPEENVWARPRQCSGWRDTSYVDVFKRI